MLVLASSVRSPWHVVAIYYCMLCNATLHWHVVPLNYILYAVCCKMSGYCNHFVLSDVLCKYCHMCGHCCHFRLYAITTDFAYHTFLAIDCYPVYGMHSCVIYCTDAYYVTGCVLLVPLLCLQCF